MTYQMRKVCPICKTEGPPERYPFGQDYDNPHGIVELFVACNQCLEINKKKNDLTNNAAQPQKDDHE